MASPVTTSTFQHTLATVIAEIAKPRSIEVETQIGGWIITLKKGTAVKHIWGYTFPLNSASSAKVCSDKAAASALMKANKIPHICHHLFPNPIIAGKWLAAESGVFSAIHAYAKKHSYNVVCKPREGTGGIDVTHTETCTSLDATLVSLFNTQRDVVISAYKNISTEYRVIVLNNEAELVFAKIPPYVVGDGVTPLGDLVRQSLRQMDPKHAQRVVQDIDPSLFASSDILSKGDERRLHWKHNLGQGASAVLLGGNSFREVTSENAERMPLVAALSELAKKTAHVLDLKFGSVDIVAVGDPKFEKRLRVMEVNQGVMMESLMAQHKELGKKIAYRIYEKALDAMFQ